MRTVFHLTARDEGRRTPPLGNVANLHDDDDSTPTESVVLVATADGNGLFDREGSPASDRVADPVDRGVSFRVCRNATDAAGTTADDLLPGVATVPAGVGERTRLQADGYAYIRIP